MTKHTTGSRLWHRSDLDKPANDMRTAQILAIHDGNVLYHRLDIPPYVNPVSGIATPRRFVLPEEVFFGRYV